MEDYIFIQRLGSCGKDSPVLWLAKKKSSDNLYVLKFFNAKNYKALAAFWREAKVLEDLNDSGIQGISKITAHYMLPNEDCYLLMEYIPGEPLNSLLTCAGAFHLKDVKSIALQLATIIGRIHSHGYIHRDIKASNIIFSPNGSVILIDFGLARDLKTGNRAWTLCGTFHAMAPELVALRFLSESMDTSSHTQGCCRFMRSREAFSADKCFHLSRNGYSFPADWWALGILVYELIVGYPPFGYEMSLTGKPFNVLQKLLGSPATISFPEYLFDAPTTNFISKLLEVEEDVRLGSSGGPMEVLGHEIFRGYPPLLYSWGNESPDDSVDSCEYTGKIDTSDPFENF